MPGKKGFRYVYSVGHINTIIEKIHETGRPPRLTMSYLKNTWLLKNQQYNAVLVLLREMDFLDSSGVPKELYAECQNPEKAGRALAIGTRNAYPDLFKAYPDAHKLPKETLEGYIRQQTGAGQSVLDKISGTFRRLCSLADFTDVQKPPVPRTKGREKAEQQLFTPPESLIPITMNIQIVIPSDATEEQYDRIFSSLKKFLMK